MQKNDLYCDALYRLLFYLSGHGGVDYSVTTRRGMLEGVLRELYDHDLLDDKTHELASGRLIEQYKNHPLYDQVRKCMAKMPRELDETLDDINGIFWVKNKDDLNVAIET